MSNLPKPKKDESVGDYIQRLLADKVIAPNQIPMAVANFNNQ